VKENPYLQEVYSRYCSDYTLAAKIANISAIRFLEQVIPDVASRKKSSTVVL